MTTEDTPKAADERRHYRTIWISDLHLGTRGCQAEALIRFLKEHSCDQLYLVGDIIDGWRLKKNLFWPQSHVNVVRRILTLSKRGTEVIYVTGNHDEFLRGYGEAAFGSIYLVDEYEHTTADGKRLLVLHGDRFDTVVRYHKWVAHLGDVAYESLLVLNRWFNGARRLLGYDYWSLSAFLKHRVKQAVSFITDFEETLAYECRRRGYDGVVCGHIHHAEIRTIDDVDYFNCGDWVESCSALVEDQDGKIEIIHWLEEERKQEQLLEEKGRLRGHRKGSQKRSRREWRKAG